MRAKKILTRRKGIAAALVIVLTLAAAAGQAGQPAQDTPSSAAKPAETPAQTLAKSRKEQLAADSAKLLQLAAELKAEVDKTTKDQLSVAVVKKADEVEKLARKVREELKLVPAN